MAINGATPLVGSTTYVAPTGGSADTLAATGDSLTATALFAGDTEFLTQKEIAFTVKKPVVSVSAPNGYTQARRTALLKTPLELDNGARTVNTLKMELAVDIETTTAEIQEMLFIGSQLLADGDYTNYWCNGNTN